MARRNVNKLRDASILSCRIILRRLEGNYILCSTYIRQLSSLCPMWLRSGKSIHRLLAKIPSRAASPAPRTPSSLSIGRAKMPHFAAASRPTPNVSSISFCPRGSVQIVHRQMYSYEKGRGCEPSPLPLDFGNVSSSMSDLVHLTQVTKV